MSHCCHLLFLALIMWAEIIRAPKFQPWYTLGDEDFAQRLLPKMVTKHANGNPLYMEPVLGKPSANLLFFWLFHYQRQRVEFHSPWPSAMCAGEKVWGVLSFAGSDKNHRAFPEISCSRRFKMLRAR